MVFMEKGGGAKVESIEGGGINNDHFLYFPSARDVSERKLLTHKDVFAWPHLSNWPMV